ncbi:MAG: cytochrome c3 family protein [Clostridiales bacterium]|jgi:predicted CXXCH cytochrome family protein|nr:cytochrome c3 family protein [Clostridiales bacterium]
MPRTILAILILLILPIAGCATQNQPAPNVNNNIAKGDANCASCHNDLIARYEATAHGTSGLTCSDCHSGIDAHIKNVSNLPSVDYRADTCAACHQDQHAQWTMSPHAQIPLDLFPKDPRIMECMKCHQASGFAAVLNSGDNFKQAWAPPPTSEPEAVTCTACHSPHQSAQSQLLRLPKGELCSQCHGGKWQNLVMTGTGGYHYNDYSALTNHPHNSGDRCVTCHMDQTPGVPNLGGHTFSMRAPDGSALNTAACVSCHGETDNYDIAGRQQEAQSLLTELQGALEERNNGSLPGNEPGTCNQCHRGGTLPFDNDPDLILENAYENYKLFDRDKSLGVHNSPFVLQLLRDTLEDIKNNYNPE